MKRKDWILKIGIFIMFLHLFLQHRCCRLRQRENFMHWQSADGLREQKNSQELMYSRLCENKLDNYVTSQKNIHAYSYDYKEGYPEQA